MPEQDVHLGNNGYSICRVQFFNRKARRNCEEVVLIFWLRKTSDPKGDHWIWQNQWKEYAYYAGGSM
jgi:hypothetical protein